MIDPKDAVSYADSLETDALKSGYNLNPDREFVEDLAKGLLVNRERYGYPSCPCRLSKGSFKEDKDLICPCDYRDEDLDEYGACFCALYVSKEVLEGKRVLSSIPDRRLKSQAEKADRPGAFQPGNQSYPVWRCSVCGYLCARNNPPEVCPICKVGKERFERF